MELIIIAVAMVGLWLLLTLPARRQRQKLAQIQANLAIGDEVMMAAGIFGTIRAIEADVVDLEIATGVQIRVARGAILQDTAAQPTAEALTPTTTIDGAEPTAPETTEY